MTLSPRLLEMLVCPRCRGRVAYCDSPERIECTACAVSYPVIDDIPVMLIDEAKPLS